ncbi:hypothetical protein ACIQ1J_31095 [Streptomyces sp. NPDC097107]|uniref:hypothetical protein n=1 Tax=Streptomyces sp. NPDC097107 TaxID=3366089 RepID=UPI0037F6EB8F
MSLPALHLLQSALAHVNTLLLQDIPNEEKWKKRLTDADRRGPATAVLNPHEPVRPVRARQEQPPGPVRPGDGARPAHCTGRCGRSPTASTGTDRKFPQMAAMRVRERLRRHRGGRREAAALQRAGLPTGVPMMLVERPETSVTR